MKSLSTSIAFLIFSFLMTLHHAATSNTIGFIVFACCMMLNAASTRLHYKRIKREKEIAKWYAEIENRFDENK
jgi:midasin (ATPase involved in ribosome maturation)